MIGNNSNVKSNRSGSLSLIRRGSLRRFLLCCGLAATGLSSAVSSYAFWWWGSKVDSVWTSGGITVDGDGKEWDLSESDDDDGLTFAFANDDKNLYLLVVPHTKGARAQMQGIYGQDFFVWIDTSAGKNEKIAIKFEDPGSSSSPKDRTVYMIGLDTAAAPADEPDGGVLAAIGALDGHGALEARIPFSNLDIGAVLPKRISVELVASAMKNPPKKKKAPRTNPASQSASENSPDGSGAAMGHGGGRGGGKRPQPPAFEEEDNDPIQVWVRVTLAESPSGGK